MDANNNIRNRLYDLETPPPQGAWSVIANMLDNEAFAKTTDAPIITMVPKVHKTNWLRIAAAASFIGFVTMSVLYVTKNTITNNTNSVANAHTPTNTKDQVTVKKVLKTQDAVVPNINATTTTTNNTTSNNTVSNIKAPKNNNVLNPVTPMVKKSVVNINTDLIATNTTTKKVLPTATLSNIVIKDANGNVIRDIAVIRSTEKSDVAGPNIKGDKSINNVLNKISLKSDTEEIDNIIQNSSYWKAQIAQWRKQLIKSGYAPSVVNIMDAAELQKLLKK